MVDSDDPDTNLLTTYAIRPEDKPTEEFERQLRVLNSQLERTNHGKLDHRNCFLPISLCIGLFCIFSKFGIYFLFTVFLLYTHSLLMKY